MTTQRMVGPDGGLYDIPLDKIEEAKSSGYDTVQRMVGPKGDLYDIPSSKVEEAKAQNFSLEEATPKFEQPSKFPQAKAVINAISNNKAAQVGGEFAQSAASGFVDTAINLPFKIGSTVGAVLNEGINRKESPATSFGESWESAKKIGKVAKDAWNNGIEGVGEDLIPVQDWISQAKTGITSLVNPEDGDWEAQYKQDKELQQQIKDSNLENSFESAAGAVGTLLGGAIAPWALGNQALKVGFNSSTPLIRNLSTNKNITSKSGGMLFSNVTPGEVGKPLVNIVKNPLERITTSRSGEGITTITKEVPETVSSLLKSSFGVIKDWGKNPIVKNTAITASGVYLYNQLFPKEKLATNPQK